MKIFIVLSLCVAGTLCTPIPGDAIAAIAPLRSLPALVQEEIRDELGQYKLHYVTAEGTVVSESAYFIPNNEGTGKVLIIKGEVSYVGDDGKTYVTKYTAGLDGYKANGSHLPKAPEVPELEPITA